MIDYLSLIKNTSAYRTVKNDKKAGRLSHAYLILTADKDKLLEYAKIFAKLSACESDNPCGQCRACRLIDDSSHPDVIFYPQKSDSVTAEDVNSLIEESFLKPIESDKKIFVILSAESMNLSAQNKLLKTLEEPPVGVHILLLGTSEFPLLPTVKSRVKKLEIPAFSNDLLLEALSQDCPDTERLKWAVCCGDGTVGKALSLYGDQKLKELSDFVEDVILNMQSSKDVLLYSTKFSNVKAEVDDFLSVLELYLRDMLVERQGREDLAFNKSECEKLKNAQKFNTGAILYALDAINEARKKKKFNMTATMLVEWLLFQILEGKYKWQKF